MPPKMRLNMHKEDVKAAIRKRGMDLRSLSLGAGLAADTAYVSLTKPLPRANSAIATFLNMPLHAIWPEWYDENGHRIYKNSLSSKSTKSRAKSHCQKRREKSTKEKRSCR